MIVDNDLLSMQQARILAENAFAGQQRLALFSQEKLDTIVEAMAAAILPHCRELAVQAQEETTYGKWQDKWVKNRFVCQEVVRQLRGLRCIGKVSEDTQNGLTEIGVPMGVVVALCPVTSPVSTTIFKSLAAVKSGNAILFSPHPKASKSIGAALDILYDAALKAGLPEGCIGYLRTVTKSGTVELMQHQYTSMLLVTGAGSMYTAAVAAGKPLIYGGAGSGPAFVERTADIRRAARDIILSKSFDNGIAPSAEQSIVVDACISGQVKEALQQESGYFLNPEQSDTLASLLFCPNSRRKRDTVGLTAEELAERAGFTVPAGTKVLIAERSYVLESTPYSRELHAPVLAYYVEDDWMHACEKCIELLLYERKAHTLVIHSNAPAVIEQFALRKPVGRLLVNTPSVFGGMGMTTNLFPSPVLGGASSGHGIIAGNVSPKNLVYMRTVGYRMRDFQPEFSEPTASGQTAAAHTEKTVSQPESSQPGALQVLEHLLNETIEAMQRPSAS